MKFSLPRSGRPALAVLTLFALLLASWPPAPVTAQGPLVTLVVQLKAPPAARAAAQARATGKSFDDAAYRAQLSAAQDAFLARLASQGIPATPLVISAGDGAAAAGRAVVARWTYTVNGLAIQTLPTAEQTIRAMSEVRHVAPDHEVRALLDQSVPYIHAPETWNGFHSADGDRARGQGVVVADIDTGIDWTNPEFTDNPLTPPGDLHRKVKLYTTYTGGVIDDFGHGTHVGSTIAGDKGLGYNKLAGADPTDDLSTARFDGVAPLADLWGYKVLTGAGTGLSTSIITAIDDAADPTSPTHAGRRADVMNLSLGSTDDDPESAESVSVNNAMLAGSVMAVAAGNEGPGYKSIGTPATAYLPITVGASTDPGDNQYFVEHRVGSTVVKQLNIGLFSNSPAPPSDPAIVAPYTFVGLGCSPADYAGKTPVTGRIALIERGTCTFTVKAYVAQTLGASAAVIFNNVPGDYSGSMEQTTIPVASLAQDGGQYLAALADTLTGDSGANLLRFDPQSKVIAGQVAGFSSRGPTADYRIKPDVMAPGNAITAATSKVGVPTQSMANASGYTTAGGTSMATPHVAGAAALLRQIHPGWTTSDIKNALMNTARILLDPRDEKPYSVMDQGAGLIDVYAAASAKGLLTATNKYAASTAVDPAQIASYSFGEIENYGGRVSRKVSFTIRDLSGTARTYDLRFEPGYGHDRGGWGRTLPTDGISFALSSKSVKVPANGSATFTLTVAADGNVLPDGDYEGRVYATASDQTLHAPIFYRSVHKQAWGSSAPVLDQPLQEDQSGHLPSGSFDLDWSNLAGVTGYRLQEATQLTNVPTASDDGEKGFDGNWSTTGTTCNTIIVGACQENPLGGWISQDLNSHSGLAFQAIQGKDQDNVLYLKQPVTLPPGVASISYWTYFDTEPDYDFGYIEASRDGVNWAVLDSVTGYSGDVDGNQGGWVQRTADLGSFSGGTVQLRFHYVTDPINDAPLYQGWFVDDISVNTANWQTIAEPKRSDYRVTGRANGAYYYRVAGLFDTADVKRAVSPWSNSVDALVGPAAAPVAPRVGVTGTPLDSITATVDKLADSVTQTVDQLTGTATQTVDQVANQAAGTITQTAPAAPSATTPSVRSPSTALLQEALPTVPSAR